MNNLGYRNDKEIEKLWQKLEDVPFIEDETSGDSCGLILDCDWFLWKKGTTRDTIWNWFDEHYSKGLGEGLLC